MELLEETYQNTSKKISAFGGSLYKQLLEDKAMAQLLLSFSLV